MTQLACKITSEFIRSNRLKDATPEEAEIFDEIYRELKLDQNIEAQYEQYMISRKVVMNASDNITYEQFDKQMLKQVHLLITSKMIRNEYIYFMLYKSKDEEDPSMAEIMSQMKQSVPMSRAASQRESQLLLSIKSGQQQDGIQRDKSVNDTDPVVNPLIDVKNLSMISKNESIISKNKSVV